MTTSGPGATNLVTGLADAFMDSTPMVAITGQVGTSLLGNDAFQEADMRGITMPITKHNYQVQSADELPEVFAEAFYVALSGRPGPVLIDLPRDVAVSECERRQATPLPPTGYKPPFKGHPFAGGAGPADHPKGQAALHPGRRRRDPRQRRKAFAGSSPSCSTSR